MQASNPNSPTPALQMLNWFNIPINCLNTICLFDTIGVSIDTTGGSIDTIGMSIGVIVSLVVIEMTMRVVW